MSLLITALFVILGDQVIKYAVFTWLGSQTVVSGFLRLTHVTNPGIAFGIGKSIESANWGKYFFIFLSLGIVIALLVLFARYHKKRLWARIALGLIVGGAISNLWDRLVFGHVRDFIDFSFWPTFNAADLAICVGVVVLVAGMFREKKTVRPPVKSPSPLDTLPSGREADSLSSVGEGAVSGTKLRER